MLSHDLFGDIVAHNLHLLFEGQTLKSSHFGRLNMIIEQADAHRTNIAIANTLEVANWLSICIFTFDRGPF